MKYKLKEGIVSRLPKEADPLFCSYHYGKPNDHYEIQYEDNDKNYCIAFLSIEEFNKLYEPIEQEIKFDVKKPSKVRLFTTRQSIIGGKYIVETLDVALLDDLFNNYPELFNLIGKPYDENWIKALFCKKYPEQLHVDTHVETNKHTYKGLSTIIRESILESNNKNLQEELKRKDIAFNNLKTNLEAEIEKHKCYYANLLSEKQKRESKYERLIADLENKVSYLSHQVTEKSRLFDVLLKTIQSK